MKWLRVNLPNSDLKHLELRNPPVQNNLCPEGEVILNILKTENVSIPKREIDPQRWRTLDKASLNSLNSVANPTAEIRVCWCSLAILSCRSWVWDGVGAALRQELSSTMAINGMTLCSKIDCYYPTWQFMSLLTWSKANFSILKCFSCLYN